MKPRTTTLALNLTLALLLQGLSHGALTAYWNFNSLSVPTAETPGSGAVPTSLDADLGSGTLSLASWLGKVDDFAGTTLNRLNADAAGQSLSLLPGNSPYPGNGSSITLHFSMLGLHDPTLSFALQGTATGFTSNQLAWSVNGTDFTDVSAPGAATSSYALQNHDLASVDALDGSPDVWLRLTFDGASGSSGNNRIDNLKITSIPETGTLCLLGTGLSWLLARRRRL